MNGVTAYKCRSCGYVMYPGHFRCLHCEGREFEEVEPGEVGKLITYTEVFNLPWGIDERSRTIGIVEFEDGVKAMGQIKATKLKIGMKLKADWELVRVIQGEEVHGLTFYAAR
ncbi:MAG: OB-fold domain-containing protein [Anaerolineae bacterium]